MDKVPELRKKFLDERGKENVVTQVAAMPKLYGYIILFNYGSCQPRPVQFTHKLRFCLNN